MLAAARRIRRSADFADTIRTGRRAGRGTVVVHLVTPVPAATAVTTATEPAYAPGEHDSPPARAGFVVSKAVGKAVPRNRVRRRLRHLVAARLTDLPAGSALVVRALPGAADRSYAELGADLDDALAAARRPGRSQDRSDRGTRR
jgi:ribonuclease P protein component